MDDDCGGDAGHPHKSLGFQAANFSGDRLFAFIKPRKEANDRCGYANITRPRGPALIDALRHDIAKFWPWILHEIPDYGGLIERDDAKGRDAKQEN